MTVQLSPEQQRWLEAQVAAGNFSSLEEAVAVAIADLMAAAEDDLDWAKPLVDEAIASVERGEGIPADEAWERILKPIDR
jgi:antitoxin ParD1/3/4